MAHTKLPIDHVKSHFKSGIYTEAQVRDFVERDIIESNKKNGVFIDCGEDNPPVEVVVTYRGSTGIEVPHKESLREHLYGEAEKFLQDAEVLFDEEEDILSQILGAKDDGKAEDVPVASEEEEEIANTPKENPEVEAELEKAQEETEEEKPDVEAEEEVQEEAEHAELSAQNFNF